MKRKIMLMILVLFIIGLMTSCALKPHEEESAKETSSGSAVTQAPQEAAGEGQDISQEETTLLSGRNGDGLSWTLDDEGILTFHGVGPLEENSYYASWYDFRESVKTVIVENGITAIGPYVFADCNHLESVSISASVTDISAGTFWASECLLQIEVDEGNSAFSSVDGVLFNRNKTVLYVYPAGRSGDYTIPDSVIDIAEAAFCSCDRLSSLTLGSNVHGIDGIVKEDAMLGSITNLENIEVTSANTYYTSYDGVLYSEDLTTILYYPPGKTGSSYSIPSFTSAIGNMAFFQCLGLQTINIPNSINMIGESAFLGCENLNSLVIPNSVNSIGSYAFSECSKLSNVIVPGEIETIPDNAFSYCDELSVVSIVSGVSTIGTNAFVGCGSLSSITIPASVVSIQPGAFSYCRSLSDVYYEGAAEDWNNIELGEGNEYLTNTAFHLNGETPSLGMPEDSVVLSGNSGVSVSWTLERDGTFVISGTGPMNDYTSLQKAPWYSSRLAIKQVVVDPGVTSIGDLAFQDCGYLVSVVLPDGITRIGSGAFKSCKALESINLPNGITIIEDLAFEYCESLCDLVIPEGTETIGKAAFEKCSSLTEIVIPDSVTILGQYAFACCWNLSSVKLPQGISDIYYGAFEGCVSLTSISIPDGVSSIVSRAFLDCPNLEYAEIPSSVVSIGGDSFDMQVYLRSVTLTFVVQRGSYAEEYVQRQSAWEDFACVYFTGPYSVTDGTNNTVTMVQERNRNSDSLVAAVNYYDSYGDIAYYESYSYYDNGLLCSATLHEVNYYNEDEPSFTPVYTWLYLYDENGVLLESLLDTIPLSGDFYEIAGGIQITRLDGLHGVETQEMLNPRTETIAQARFGVDPDKTEYIYGGASVIPTHTDSNWAMALLAEEKSNSRYSDMAECRLIYVNDDDIPELWIDYEYGPSGADLYTVGTYSVDRIQIGKGTMRWIDHGNIALVSFRDTGVGTDIIYQIQYGRFAPIVGGEYYTDYDEQTGIEMHYFWDSAEIPMEEYDQKIADAFDITQATDINQNVYSYPQLQRLLEYIADMEN